MAIKRFCRKVRLLLIESGIFQQGGNVPGEFLRVVSCKATVVDLVWHAVSTAGSADYRQAVRNSFYDFYLDAGAAKYRTDSNLRLGVIWSDIFCKRYFDHVRMVGYMQIGRASCRERVCQYV